MLKSTLITFAKSLSRLSKTLNLGNGSTWPGHLALKVKPSLVHDLLENAPTKVILVVGTNGKTTTSHILATILKEEKKKVLQNTSGANLLNGIASTLLLGTNTAGKLTADYAIFEVDENNLPIVLQYITPSAIIALDLFRDQLDRYGELDSIAKKWNHAFQQLTHETKLMLNADDPLIAYLAKDVKAQVEYFGLGEKELGQKSLADSADSVYCPQCGHRLTYKKIFYSHLGIWECPNCHVKRPQPQLSESRYPLPGIYNKYNTLAAVLTAKSLGIGEKTITDGLQKVTPAFGRQEALTYNGKNIQIFLSKNPTSMNESLRTISEMSNSSIIANEVKQSNAKKEIASSQAPRNDEKHKPSVLLVLNDRIPDGRDVSWIWDISMEEYIDQFKSIVISGDRCYDMGLRISYSMQFPISNFQFPMNNQHSKFQIYENLKEAIEKTSQTIDSNETLYILPTYSAMLEVRKILTGRKIL